MYGKSLGDRGCGRGTARTPLHGEHTAFSKPWLQVGNGSLYPTQDPSPRSVLAHRRSTFCALRSTWRRPKLHIYIRGLKYSTRRPFGDVRTLIDGRQPVNHRNSKPYNLQRCVAVLPQSSVRRRRTEKDEIPHITSGSFYTASDGSSS